MRAFCRPGPPPGPGAGLGRTPLFQRIGGGGGECRGRSPRGTERRRWMFTNCGSATGAGSVSISTGSAASLAGMRRVSCPAELCLICREEADTPEHVLLRCPCLAGARLRILDTIYMTPTQLQDDGVVAASARDLRRGGGAGSRTAGGQNNSSLDDALRSHCVHGKGTHMQRHAADILNLRITDVHRG